MTDFGASDRLKQSFIDQFQLDASGFIFRKNTKGPAIRVNSEERDDMIAAYIRSARYSKWALVAATVVFILGAVAMEMTTRWLPMSVLIWLGLGVLLVIFLIVHARNWNAPSRALQDRTPIRPALSKIEVTRNFWAKTSYQQLALAAASGPGSLLLICRQTDIFHGWGRLWLIFASAIVIVAAVQATRKWIYERRSGPVA